MAQDAKVANRIGRLAEAAQDGRMDDAAFLQAVEEAALSLPELFDPTQAEALGKDLEAAMGTAALQGARDALRDNKTDA